MKGVRPALLFVLFLAIFSSASQAQVNGRISGSVVDPSGAAVPNAKVSVMLAGGKLPAAQTVTNSAGLFNVEAIRPELYDIVIEAEGFVPYKLSNVKVDPARSTDLVPAKLQLPATTQSVEVTAGAETIQLNTNDLSTTVTKEQIERLPVSDRDPLGFISTQAGVAPTAFGTTINGQRVSFSSVKLDGVNIQDNYIRDNALDFTPNLLLLDQVKEFTVTTSNPDASLGGGSSHVSMSTPSGTNALHGNLLWQNRNNTLAANDWFGNQDGLPLQRLNQNQFGGSLYGPIKKDKLFYYTNYEGLRLRSEDPVDQTILTQDARQGIFTWVDTRTQQVRKANILQIVALTPDPLMAKDLAQTATPDKINNFRVGDSSADLLRNTAGYSFLARSNRDRDNATGKLDYSLSTKHTLYATFAWNRDLVDRPDFGIGYTPVSPYQNDNASKVLSIGWRWNPSPALTNEVRGGFDFAPGYFVSSQSNPPFFIGGTIYSSPVPQSQPQGRLTRTYTIEDNAIWNHSRHTVKFGYQMQGVRVRTYDYAGTTPTYNVGIDSLNQGAYLLFQSDLPGVSASDLNSANLLLASLAGLLDNANVTYNVTSRTSGYIPGAPYLRHYQLNNHAFYVQDLWKVMDRLSFSAGLRWDYYAPVNERDSLALQPVLVAGDARKTMLSDALLYFSGNSIGRPFYKRDLNNFGPNAGIAWDPFGKGKTSIRASYGISYVNDQSILMTEGYVATNQGLQAFPALYDLGGFMNSDRPQLAAPKLQIPQKFSDVYANDSAAAFSLVDPALRTPYVQEWNVSIQHEIKGNIIEARYVGNHSTKMLRGFDYNQTDITSNGFLADFLRAQNNGNLSRAAGRGFVPTYNAAIPGSQPLTVFPKLYNGGYLANSTVRTLIDRGEVAELAAIYQVNGINGSLNFFPNPNALDALYVTNYSNARYDSIQLEVRRRFRQGLEFQANYVFSKLLGDGSEADQYRFEPFMDINNPQLARARLATDLTHQFKANYAYELPFGKGHRIQSRWLNDVIGGWTTSGTLSWVSGNPFSVYSGRGTFLREGFSGFNEANTLLSKGALQSIMSFQMTGNGPYMVQKSALYTDGRAVAPDGSAPFDGQVFYNPGAGTIGTLQRRTFTGPNIFGMDAAVHRAVRLRERYDLLLIMEALNVFNHPTFAIFSQNINSTQFGRITSEYLAPRRLQLGLRLQF
jgi:hypothetical protein